VEERRSMAEGITELNEKNFDGFISEGNSVVDFWASWCGPCKMMAPEFEAASKQIGEKVRFGKVNVEDNQKLAERFQVISIPTLLFFKGKEQVERTSGMMGSNEIVAKVEEAF
jgi:thioredoxin 1